MKATKEIFKVNGRSFRTYEEVEKYARENNYRISNTITSNYSTKRLMMKVHHIELITL
jgi:hypothetical protein